MKKKFGRFRVLILLVIVFISTTQLKAQNLTIDVNEAGKGPSPGMIMITNSSAIGDKKAKGLTYEDVEGTPFWNEHWNSALLYFKSGTIYTLPKAKLNLYTTEVHYENEKGVELVAETILIDKIVFLNSKDATKVLAAFAVLPDYIDNKPAGFFRVFNDGAYQLILLQKNLVKVSPFDPLTGKNITSFFTKYYYGIYNNGKTIPLKALDRNSILSVIPFNASVEPWIKNTKNKLKSEEDIIALLKYYNSIVAVK
ncbi:MAG: hypothetical protein NTY43_03110 [Bacteroidetes bacterium]|jgi:hypothetical protein|nr:hypothetical protein [Bacteroidota bacterium]